MERTKDTIGGNWGKTGVLGRRDVGSCARQGFERGNVKGPGGELDGGPLRRFKGPERGFEWGLWD